MAELREPLQQGSSLASDFAVTFSSPQSCCTLFAMASEQTVELKWLMLNKHKKWFHSSRVKFPLVSMSASWFLVSMYLIWIFGVQNDSIEEPIKRNSVGPGNVSHCLTSSLYNHLDHCFVVFKHIQQSFLMRGQDVWGNGINIIQNVEHSLRSACLARDSCHSSQQVVPVLYSSDSCSQELQRSDPINQVWVYRPLLNPVSKEIFSDSVELCETAVCFLHIQLMGTMYDFQKRITFLQKWILSPQDLLRSQSLETVLVCIVTQCYPHNNTVCIHTYGWIYEINRFRRLSQALVHFVIDRAKFIHWP